MAFDSSALEEALYEQFCPLVPRIRAYAFGFFRHIRCQATMDDCVAEMTAIIWRWSLEDAQKGRDFMDRFKPMLWSAAHRVQSGRGLMGQRTLDALSPIAQVIRGFSTVCDSSLAEAVEDDAITPIPDQAAFRCDFPEWLLTRSERDRRLIQDMAMGWENQHLAAKYGVGHRCVTRLRLKFQRDWQRFTDAPEPD